jgi:transcription initiation factor TFIID subunit 15
MGDIPSSSNMISSIITNPAPGDDLDEDTDFTVDVQVDNLAAGSFTNPDVTYYSAPQTLDDSGNVVGHTHVTIQSLGDDVNTQTAPDPSQFVFFKGINDAGDGNGGLSADVTGGLPAGAYRVCTMTSSSNHQPVLMPVSITTSPSPSSYLVQTDNLG